MRARPTKRGPSRGRATPTVRYIAGGTTLLDLMRLDVMRPRTLIDLNALPLAKIEANGDGLRIGAMVRNSDLAYDPQISARYPALREALLSGASPQIRNMATLGGNLLQRTRCAYFRDPVAPCNKRDPGTGCSAIGGYARMHALLGVSDKCIAAHPSDMCVALVALDAAVRVRGKDGATRSVPIADFHTLPGDHPEIESVLQQGELITHVDLPQTAFAARSHYVKVRDRASYAFALTSAAVALDVQNGVIREARVALGGVATKPWRSVEAERELTGKAPSEEVYRRAAAAAIAGASPQKDNRFKVALVQKTIVRALREIGGAT